ncbi:unnamed protein product [Medioppia subpectinata]|uniref:Uncharacterized protein n=1 Tax=Medioppia subpectinata TaxID=1979941 RepID=A0A7R9KEZ2_9ACAR|nr:unnamed protein product [Medioppia subpectinata]CAG2101113.1 unnamed protein product [Medioppia subpectinata]
MKFIILSLLCLHLLHSLLEVDCGGHGMRTQYHEQGLDNPHSYKFGYTTGDHYNPQSRHEVSHGPGHVKGSYSFRDPHGKIHVVHYEAHPKYGFRTHHKKGKR